ncbi:MAG: hypothetical protein KJ893_08800 [Candidatus Omnitrophica bacterium]|nr:hypothetical protein [Candidatus Omnitrophota bacterium]MBU4478110.1 hypothetical protein [Candidatus Omnitrophota bacterium]MCG2702933.1 ATP-binding protein [Candidatus Omnitrophota bacterium]
MEYEDIKRFLEESQQLNALMEEFLECIKKNKEVEKCIKCTGLMENIKSKLKGLKQKNKDIMKLAMRSLHSQRLVAMGQMAAAISHELRNPLSGIKVAAEYLMRKLKGQPDALDIIVNIHNEVIFANNIITNILEHARISKPNLGRASLKRLIEEALLTMAQQGSFNNIEVKKDISDNLPVLDLDVFQMRQVLMNLFINAAEAMIGGGTLDINAYYEGETVTLQISDDGCGIEKSHIDKLFEPFFSTKVKGIGLGLAIAKEIIENHGGEISVESKLGKGATFTIVLPVANKETA